MNKIELCMITKSNRPQDIKNWVDWHLFIGFDKIIIIDNNSTYSIKELLRSYDKVEVREIKENYWMASGFKTFYDTYNSITTERRGKTEHLCFLDDDEYIYIEDKRNIKEILIESQDVHSIYWKMISSPVLLEDRKDSLINTFHHVAPLHTEWSNNTFVKSIVNLEKCSVVGWTTPHIPDINLCKRGCTLNGKIINRDSELLHNSFYDGMSVVIYHYYHQSWKDWIWKCERAGRDNQGNTCRILDKQFFIDSTAGKYIVEDNKMIDRKIEMGI